MKNENKLLFFTNDINIKTYLNKYKTNENIYNLVSSAFNILGTFNRYVQFELYDFIQNDKQEIVRAACTDNNGTVFIINIFSTIKRNLKIVEVVNENDIIYDLSIVKHDLLNENNIELCKNNMEINTKFGRICTDKISYYNILFASGAHYVINGKFDNIDNFEEIFIKTINKYEKTPSIQDIFNILETINNENTHQIDSISIYDNNDKLISKITFEKEKQLIREKKK